MKHPIQNIVIDSHGTAIFTENKIISHMIDKYGLNELHCDCHMFDDADWDQLHQLIGYSVSGCPMRNMEAQAAADAVVESLNRGVVVDVKDAYIKELESQLFNLKKKIKDVASELFGIHPDDFYIAGENDA